METLIFDAAPRHTVEIVRSLGRKGIRIDIMSDKSAIPARWSRYVRSFFSYSTPKSTKEEEKLLNWLGQNHYDVIIPAGLWGFHFLSKYRGRFSHTEIPVADFDSYEIAYDKGKTVEFCKTLGVLIPQTYFVKSHDDIDRITSDLCFPVVLKAAEEWGSVKYANNRNELHMQYENLRQQFPEQLKSGKAPMVQEYIQGDGYGFYALMNKGKLRALFMHKRLREMPPTGGPSSLACSYYDEHLKELGLRVLKALNWHGVAMVEFKKDQRDDEYKLMEINPKFWGSLALPIKAGIDFPYLLFKMAIDGDIDPVFDYDRNIVFQWLTMDLAHALTVRKPLLYIKTLLDKRVSNDFDFSDPLPNIALFLRGFTDFLGNKKFPHGKPMLSNNSK